MHRPILCDRAFGARPTRMLLFVAAASVAVLTGSTVAHAACGGGPNDRRLLVSAQPDLFFTAGVPSTQYIPVVFVNHSSAGEPGQTFGDDCGTLATSHVQGVSVQDTYCFWDTPGSCQFHAPGTGSNAAVDHATSYSTPAVYRNNETNHLRPIPVHYDGTSPAGTSGTIDIGYQDEFGTLTGLIGRINVYVVSTSTPTWFTATSSATNISGDSFVINNPLTNGNTGAMIFISHRFSGTYWPHPTAVWYDSSISKWKIRNEDGAAMPAGMVFNVRYEPSGSVTWVPACSISRFAFACNAPNYAIINDPRTNGNPYATILVSGTSWGSRRLNHPVAVAYAAPYWEIMTTDGQNLGTNDEFGNGVGFFVKIVGASVYADDNLYGDASGFTNTGISNGVGTDINGPYRINGPRKYLSDFCFATKGLVPMLVTQNVTPLPAPAPHNYNSYDPDYFGVDVSGSYMAVVHETASKSMPGWSAFNVWAPYRTDCAPY